MGSALTLISDPTTPRLLWGQGGGWRRREGERLTQGQAFQEPKLFSRQGKARLAIDWMGIPGCWR